MTMTSEEKQEEKKVIDEMNTIKSTHELYNYICRVFLFDDFMDTQSNFFEKLEDISVDIEMDYPDMSQYEIDEKVRLMKDMVNEEYKKGTLNYYYRPPKENLEK